MRDKGLSIRFDIQSILAFAPNGLTSPDNAIEGMVLILPKAVPPPPAAATKPLACGGGLTAGGGRGRRGRAA